LELGELPFEYGELTLMLGEFGGVHCWVGGLDPTLGASSSGFPKYRIEGFQNIKKRVFKKRVSSY